MKNIFDTPLCRHEYVLSFCVRNSRKSDREQKLCCAKQKQKNFFRVKRKCARVFGKEREREKEKRQAQLATAAPFGEIKSILFVRVRFCIHLCVFFRFVYSSACCYLVEKISVEHHRQHESKANAESGTYRQKSGFHFIFPFHVSFSLLSSRLSFSSWFSFETTDNLETQFFLLLSIRRKNGAFFVLASSFSGYFFKLSNAKWKRNDEKKKQRWEKKRRKESRESQNATAT